MFKPERRRIPRFPFHTQAELILGKSYQDATLLDISRGGALIQPRRVDVLHVGMDCTLRVLGSNRRQAFELDAFVVWNREEGMVGLKTTNFGACAEHALSRLIEMNLGSNALLNPDVCALLKSPQLGSSLY